MTLSEDLKWRGLIKDTTFDDLKWLDKPQSFYLGIDCSADSLTVGNLAVLILARRLVESGWKAVLLVGGATSLIGDPGGKQEERDLKSREEIVKNVGRIKKEIDSLFGGHPYVQVDNYDWFKDIGYLEFLRDVGKNYSMTELMQREFVTQRMGEGGSGISYAEFSYSLIQGYDYWHLHKNHGVVLQIGGSDQWGNMLSGVPLIRKKEGKQVHAFSMPLVVDKSTGQKFGKSEAGAIWLNPAKTSETQFRQFWINVDDADVEDYLKIFTFASREEIGRLMAAHQKQPQLRLAQNFLSQKVAEAVHTKQASAEAEELKKVLTGETPIDEADEAVIHRLRSEIPYTTMSKNGTIVEALVRTGLASSNSDARRLLEAGAIYVNGQSAKKAQFEADDFLNGRLILRRGKAYKDSALVELK
ncbi:MAG: tyrosine--tRNA ligase [Candidatus Saccharimonadales bacterium]